ncbi:MAG: oligosaccharide flippase family protein [Muribaculaceae bacterium]|nr:oligosaccharide flippase family protein [Muribaculaceae bacterium]
MAEASLKRQAFHSIIWKILETGGIQFIQFAISVVLARLVLPDQFSAIAMLSIFLAIAETFVNSGFSSALIRKTDRTQAS